MVVIVDVCVCSGKFPLIDDRLSEQKQPVSSRQTKDVIVPDKYTWLADLSLNLILEAQSAYWRPALAFMQGRYIFICMMIRLIFRQAVWVCL
jgi:hypothetical protein